MTRKPVRTRLRDDMIVLTSGSNSVVECQLPKLDVAGSSPVARSHQSRRTRPGSRIARSGPLPFPGIALACRGQCAPPGNMPSTMHVVWDNLFLSRCAEL